MHDSYSSGDVAGDWDLIAEYVTGRAAPDVAAAVEARARMDASFRSNVAAALLAWERTTSALDGAVSAEETEQAWLRLSAVLAADVSRASTIPLHRTSVAYTRRPIRLAWGRAALAASIVAVAAAAVTIATGTFAPFGDAAAAPVREIVASRGQRVAVTLSDGGRVVLAPGSRLRAPERFEGDERRVTLSGRAYFEVAHDAARPFIVETDDVIVRVLGTEFDLRAYPGTSTSQVVVRNGRVAVRGAGRGASPAADSILTRGDRAVIDTAGRLTIEEDVDVDALLSWTAGRLVFERASLADVIADIERWHDVTIELADPELARLRLTAAFDREPLDIILETVAELVNARVRRDGSHIVLSRR